MLGCAGGAMTPLVGLLTKDASLDDLTLADYADIWAELRQTGSDKPRSYDKCIELMASGPSKARWQQFEKGEAGLSREMRNALRTWAGLATLPKTVLEAVGAASPDAAVWHIGIVGETAPDTIIMVTDSEPLWIRVNGSVTVGDYATVQVDAMLGSAQTQMDAARATLDSYAATSQRPAIARKAYIRPCVPVEYAERIAALGVSWIEVIDVGLKEFEA
jgi:hypothetical protein